MIEGILPVLKPVGYTSHDVVAVLRGILRIKRIGHTGTLDPQVTGVLPLCIGRATRLVEYIQELPKEYEAVLKLGIATNTEDASGQVIEQSSQVFVTEDQIKQVIASFIGTIEQVPPMYSAVKVEGKRLYELARQGKVVERKARTVYIHKIKILSMELSKLHPEIKFSVLCSKGTYIRTLCVDMGKALGYPSLMSELIRTSTGNIQLEQCLSLAEIENLHKEDKLVERMIPMDQAISFMPSYRIHQSDVRRALQGQSIALTQIEPFEKDEVEQFHSEVDLNPHQLIRLYSMDQLFLGVYKFDHDEQIMKPVKVFEECR